MTAMVLVDVATMGKGRIALEAISSTEVLCQPAHQLNNGNLLFNALFTWYT